jgi:hypothetical protein
MTLLYSMTRTIRNSSQSEVADRYLRSKKTNITLSISDHFAKQLRLQAATESVSVNRLVNSILERWALCYRAIGISGGIIITSETWKDVIEKMDEDYLLGSLDSGGSVAAAVLLQNDIPLTIDNLVKFVFQGLALYAGNYSHFHHYRNDSDDLVLVFEHSFGLKWSKLFGSSICRFFNNQLNIPTDLNTSLKNIKIVVHDNGARIE